MPTAQYRLWHTLLSHTGVPAQLSRPCSKVHPTGLATSSDSIGLFTRWGGGHSGVLPHAYHCKGCSAPPRQGSSHPPNWGLSSRWVSHGPSHGGCICRPPGFGIWGEGRIRNSNPKWRKKGGSCWLKAWRGGMKGRPDAGWMGSNFWRPGQKK